MWENDNGIGRIGDVVECTPIPGFAFECRVGKDNKVTSRINGRALIAKDYMSQGLSEEEEKKYEVTNGLV